MRSVSDLLDLTGRAALVTGGTGNIGRAIGQALAECGARVALADRVDPAAVVSDLPAVASGEHAGLIMDLTDETQVRATPDKVIDAIGSLNIIVHCAAFVGTDTRSGWTTPVEEQDLEEGAG